MNSPTTHVVRPAGAGHETLYVLLLCLLIVSVSASVVLWHGDTQEVSAVASHQLDARRDLSASEQGIYADLRVTLDEIRLLREDTQALPAPTELATEGFAPFAQDASSVSRGDHQWQLLGQAYVGLSKNPQIAGSFVMRISAQDSDQPDIWLNRSPSLSAPGDLSDSALTSAGWKQVIAQYDAGVTRQHRH